MKVFSILEILYIHTHEENRIGDPENDDTDLNLKINIHNDNIFNL